MSRQGPGRPGGAAPLLAMLVVFLSCLAAIAADRRTQGELEGLGAGERRALLQQVLRDLRGPCLRSDGGELMAVCRAEANLAAALPDCEASCRQTIAAFLPRMTR